MAEIKINTEVWRGASKELETQGRAIDEAANQMSNAFNALRSAWTGSSADVAAQGYDITVENLKSYAIRVNEISDAFEWEAQVFEMTEGKVLL